MDIDERYEVACTMADSGDFTAAEALFADIINNDPEHYKAMNKLGVSKVHLGKYYEALEILIRGLEINPGYPPLSLNMGNVHVEIEEFDKALEYYQRAIQNDRNYHLAYYNLAVLYKKMGNYNKYLSNLKEYRHLLKKTIDKDGRKVVFRKKYLIPTLAAFCLIALLVLLL